MSFFVSFGILLSVVSFSTLVIGDAKHVLKMNKLQVKNKPGEYFGDWATEIHATKKSSQLSFKIPTKKDVPDTMMVSLIINMSGQDPIESNMTLCDALADQTVGESFVNSGTPKGEFPKECPFKGGDWAVSKWTPPLEKIPSGMDGPVYGTASIGFDGKEPFVTIEYEGDLSQS